MLVPMAIVLIGLALPQPRRMPVAGADRHSFAHDSFWFYPWGRSGTHKGIDIYAAKGTPIRAAAGGLVLYAGTKEVGGNIVVVLGPKWRLFYYAHLDTIAIRTAAIVASGEHLGTVGNSGNAAGKPPHLHYAIFTLLPYPWRIDGDHQGWKKAFYLDPSDHV
ncbi:MAG: M23 family metallopeptidase [Flavobacteriales bacterium]